jgi:hypothetical protein
MVKDVGQFYRPIIQAFTRDYGGAVDFILSTSGAHVRKPFCMSLVLLGLANQFHRVDEVLAQAKKQEAFWDFHKTKDPPTIVRRVEQWFKQHNEAVRSPDVAPSSRKKPTKKRGPVT